ncbi:hypothetical protein [Pseudomonas sp. Pseu.R1]|jgi:hypothetical protein|uniref:hypothetical protein n=1 Tax=Pseudomonas sp. Pseu.R1 TaxID=3379818 RepID=UPI003B93D9D3
MFCTHESEMAGFVGMFGDGLAHWHGVSRALKTHWYHVSVKRWQDDRFVAVEEFVNDETRLYELLSGQNDTFKVSEVQVVTPAWVNGGESWRMERLQSLKMGFDSNDVPTCVFEVDSGAVYHDSHRPDFDVESLKVVKNVYRASN